MKKRLYAKSLALALLLGLLFLPLAPRPLMLAAPPDPAIQPLHLLMDAAPEAQDEFHSASDEAVEWTWQHPLPTGNPIVAIWGSGPNDIVAVDRRGEWDTLGFGSAILHHNGTGWDVMHYTTHSLSNIWGSGPNDVFAVGDCGVILHYDGNIWTKMNSGNDYSHLRGVWGDGPNDVFAVGTSNIILHYDGNTWSETSSSAYVDILDVWGSSGSDVFAVGEEGTILHFDGSAWDTMSSGTTQSLHGVWGSGPNDVFAVGEPGVILHYSGSGWTAMSGATDALFDVWGTGPNDVFAAGNGGIILHYNGSAWSATNSNTDYRFFSMWGSSSNNVYIVGDYQFCSSVILHYNGSAWSAIGSQDHIDILSEVWGSGLNDVFAAGMSYSGGPNGTILHYDGNAWTSVYTTSGYILDLWGSGPNDVFVVDNNGDISHYNGSNWAVMANYSGLVGILGNGPNDVFAFYSCGDILHYNGSNWTEISSGNSLDISEVWGSSGSDMYAIGVNDIWHYNGSAWSVVLHTTSWLEEIWGSGPSDVYAVGENILHYNGSGWSLVDTGIDHVFYSAWGSGPNDVFVGTSESPILHYNGSSWRATNTGTIDAFYDIWGSGPNDVFAVSDYGHILHYSGPTYALDVTVVGRGAVSENPYLPVYQQGNNVTLTASAHPDWVFAGWSGNIVTTTTPLTVTITSSLAVTATFSQSTQAVIEPDTGGTLVYTGSQGAVASIVVPGGGITETTTLAYTPVDTVTLPSSLNYAVLAFDLDAYQGGILQPGFQFASPVTATVTYSDSLMVGLDEEALVLVYWDEAATEWRDVAETCTPTSTYIRNLAENILSVPICHLSRFALLSPEHMICLPLVLRNH